MSVSLEVSKREVRPRSIRKKLRHEGKIPAIVNGYQVDSTPIYLEAAVLEKKLRENGVNTVFTLTIDGKKINTLIQKYQADTFTGKLTHVEFLSVNMRVETEVEAEIVLVGDALGVKAGGMLTQTLYAVTVSATPDQLPDSISVDISNLEIGDSLIVKDIPTSGSFQIVTDEQEQIASIHEPQVIEDEEDGVTTESETPTE